VVLAINGTTTVPAFVALVHPVCAAKQHDCGKTPTIAKCCCGDEQSSPHDSTPAQSRLEVRADLSLVAVVTVVVHVAMTPHAQRAIHTSPPHPCLDRPTLFSSLLI
jgi:hypothetical protein